MVKTITLRNWKLYNPIIAAAKLSSKLSGINVKCQNLSVQDHWNVMENVLITVNLKGMSPGRMWQLTVLLVFSLQFIYINMKGPNKHLNP